MIQERLTSNLSNIVFEEKTDFVVKFNLYIKEFPEK